MATHEHTLRLDRRTPEAAPATGRQRMQRQRRVLESDPGQEYYLAVPTQGAREAPVCALIHGASRKAQRLMKHFLPHAEALGVILVAPRLVAPDHAGYQRFGLARGRNRSDLVLHAIVEEVAWLTGAATQQVYLFGHAAGAQFAHRYAMAYPSRVARVAIAGAGWYTLPDPKRRFPYGMRRRRHLRDLHFDPEEFLQVPITVFVGSEDGTQANLRQGPRVDDQGTTRVERAKHWVAAMTAAAEAYHLRPAVALEILPGGGHSLQNLETRCGLGARVFGAFFGSPPRADAEHGNGAHGSE